MSVVGVVVVMAAALLGMAVTHWSTIDSLPRAVAPGSVELELDEGRYIGYSEWTPGVTPEMSYVGRGSGFECQLSGPSGNALPVAAAPLSGYTWDLVTSQSVFMFEAPADGRYQLNCGYGGASGPSAVLAIGRIPPSFWTVVLVGSIGCGLLGLALYFRLTRRQRRTEEPEARQDQEAGALRSFVASSAELRSRRPDPGEGDRRAVRLSVVAILAGVALFAVTLAVYLVDARRTAALVVNEATTQPASRAMIGFSELRSGDCLERDISNNRKSAEIPRVPCSERHAVEVYAIVNLGHGPWPFRDVIQARSQHLCSTEAHRFLGIPADQSEISLGWLAPSDSDLLDGDSVTVCTAEDPSGPMTGSLRGSRR
jgi:hypothetical protein